jgi:hypothetical protein
MTSQALFAAEFPADVLPTQLRELLTEAAPALLDGLFEDLRAIESVTIGCRESGDTFAVAIESTPVISMLPPAYRAWYSPLFVRALIACATRIGGRSVVAKAPNRRARQRSSYGTSYSRRQSQHRRAKSYRPMDDPTSRTTWRGLRTSSIRTPTGNSSTTIPKPSGRQRRTWRPPSRTSSSRSNPGSNHSTGSLLTRIPTAET